MTYIKNDIVQMDWEARCFFESRTQGFIAACQIYKCGDNEVCVVFRQNHAFLLVDNDEPASLQKVQNMLKDCFDNGEEPWDGAYEDSIFMVSTGTSIEEDNFETLKSEYGFTDDIAEDIKNRILDLSEYWAVIEQTADEFFGEDEEYYEDD